MAAPARCCLFAASWRPSPFFNPSHPLAAFFHVSSPSIPLMLWYVNRIFCCKGLCTSVTYYYIKPSEGKPPRCELAQALLWSLSRSIEIDSTSFISILLLLDFPDWRLRLDEQCVRPRQTHKQQMAYPCQSTDDAFLSTDSLSQLLAWTVALQMRPRLLSSKGQVISSESRQQGPDIFIAQHRRRPPLDGDRFDERHHHECSCRRDY